MAPWAGARRILILGSPGAGKTSLARLLAAMTGLPLVHLDDLYWAPDWFRPADDDWSRRLAAAAAEPAWIIDGNYASSLANRADRAEMALVVDTAPLICLWRVIARVRAIRAGAVGHLPRQVREQAGPAPATTRDFGRLCRLIIGFRRHAFVPMINELAQRQVRVTVIASPARARRLRRLERSGVVTIMSPGEAERTLKA